MSANIAAAQGSTTAVTQLLAGNANATNGETLPGEAGPLPFAALFQQLIGQQLGSELQSSLLTLQADATPELEGESTEELTALLPFLEAMGIAQSVVTPPVEADAEQVAANTGDGKTSGLPAILPGKSAALPANSAANTALSDTDRKSAIPVQLFEETGGDSTGSIADAPLITPSVTDEKNATAAAATDFATQLQSAIADGKDNLHTSGSPAGGHLAAHQPNHDKSISLPNLPVNQPVGNTGWSDEVGNHVVWMANRQESRAELVLNPPQMGRVEVSLSISGDQASATFVSGSPAVREALESALPRLREVLAEAGIQLGQAQVGAENPQQTAREDKNEDNFKGDRTTSHDTTSTQAHQGGVAGESGLKVGRGLVDVFA